MGAPSDRGTCRATVALSESEARKLETHVTHTPHEFEEKLWKALRSDRTVMLGINGVDESHTRPMTAQSERDGGPIWFFTSTENAMVQALGSGDARAVETLAY